MSCLDVDRKRAKQLVRWHRAGNYSVGGRIRKLLRYAHLTDLEALALDFPLHEAQEIVALEAGCERWQALRAAAADGACLHLKVVHEPVLVAGAQDRDGLITVFIEVEHVKALYAEYVDKGVTFRQGLQTQAWEGHDFIARDPDSNLLCFAGRNTIA